MNNLSKTQRIIGLIAVILLVSALIFWVVSSLLNSRLVELTSTDNIEYKVIDLKYNPAIYYCIDSDGNVYHISQEDWAELEVPVLSK